jgi:hypothetical protein
MPNSFKQIVVFRKLTEAKLSDLLHLLELIRGEFHIICILLLLRGHLAQILNVRIHIRGLHFKRHLAFRELNKRVGKRKKTRGKQKRKPS